MFTICHKSFLFFLVSKLRYGSVYSGICLSSPQIISAQFRKEKINKSQLSLYVITLKWRDEYRRWREERRVQMIARVVRIRNATYFAYNRWNKKPVVARNERQMLIDTWARRMPKYIITANYEAENGTHAYILFTSFGIAHRKHIENDMRVECVLWEVKKHAKWV